MKNSIPKHLVFYDGECGFCNHFVQLLLRKRTVDFYFIALQSSEASRILEKFQVKIEWDTVYYLENDQLFQKSTALLKIMKNLRFPYSVFAFLSWIVPSFIRDSLYLRIAQKRHAISPQNCMLPTKEELLFFLDKK